VRERERERERERSEETIIYSSLRGFGDGVVILSFQVYLVRANNIIIL